MSNRSHFILRGTAISGTACGFMLAALGAPLWLIGINEWLGAGGVGLGLLSSVVIAVERRRR